MRLLPVSCAIFASIFATLAWSAAPEETFQNVYGEQLKKTVSMRDPKASAEFAQSLVKDAMGLQDDPAFQALVFTKAYEIALKASAYPTAQDAMEKLAAAQPALRRTADDKLLIALERERRPALRPKLEAVKARIIAEKKLEQLERAVTKSPNQKDATEIVCLLLVEFDDAAKAREYAPATKDAALQLAVELAGKSVIDLSEEGAKLLGDWYYSHATSASPSGRASAMGRSKACYDRYLDMHKANDAGRLEATRRIEAIAHQAATPPPPASGNVVDLLKLVDVAGDVDRGKWTRSDEGLTGEGYVSRLRFPFEPPAFYDLRIVFTFHGERGSFAVMFTHDGGVLVWKMSMTDGICEYARLHNPPPGQIMKVEMGKKINDGSKHEAIIRVRKGIVSAYLDGKAMAQLTGDCSKVSIDDWWYIGPRSLGMLSQAATVTVYNVELAEISGHGKPSPKAAR